MRWDTWKKLRFAYTPLDEPVVFGGTVVRYAYDPRVMTRDLAAFDARVDRVEELVLITLRELGYLDETGRALLPQEALIWNTVERGRSERPSTGKIRRAIERLLSRRILTWAQGSFNRAGMLHYPARHGEKEVPLLCYAPVLRVAEREDLQDVVADPAYGASAHRVAGHLMRIGHLGKEASAEAKRAYRDDHKRAGLAGPHELPRGTPTFGSTNGGSDACPEDHSGQSRIAAERQMNTQMATTRNTHDLPDGGQYPRLSWPPVVFGQEVGQLAALLGRNGAPA